VVSCCENGNEHSGYIKCGQFIEQLKNGQLHGHCRMNVTNPYRYAPCTLRHVPSAHSKLAMVQRPAQRHNNAAAGCHGYCGRSMTGDPAPAPMAALSAEDSCEVD